MIRIIFLRLLESYFRHPWLTLLPILLFSVLGIVYTFISTDAYTAGGIISVNLDPEVNDIGGIQETGYAFTNPAGQTVNEFHELMMTDSFIRAVVNKSDLEAELPSTQKDLRQMLNDVRERLGVESAGENQVLFGATWEEPKIALQLANGLSDSFLQWHIQSAKIDSGEAVRVAQGLVEDYKEELDSSTKALEEYLILHPEPLRDDRPEVEELQIKTLQANIDIDRTRYTNALNKLEDAKVRNEQTETVVKQIYRFVDTPELPNDPNSGLKDKIISVFIFGVVGIVLSGLSIVLGAILDRSLRYPLDVQQAFGLPVLALVPAGEGYQDVTATRKTKEPMPNKVMMPKTSAIVETGRRATLIPVIDPPTLVVMPNQEQEEAIRIAMERKRHDNQTSNSNQKRQRTHGIPSRHVDPNVGSNNLPSSSFGRGGDRFTPSS